MADTFLIRNKVNGETVDVTESEFINIKSRSRSWERVQPKVVAKTRKKEKAKVEPIEENEMNA